MASYVEHVNLTVSDLDQTILFLSTALPDFQIRHREIEHEQAWVHIGNDTSYIALSSFGMVPKDENHGLNHIGLVVDDVDAVRQRLLAAGYRRGHGNGEIFEHPFRRRLYFLDHDGREYEFVQYLTDVPAERNSYED